MTAASIPVDVVNPGQVFACLGLLEAADLLDGPAEGGFQWHDEESAGYRFELRTATPGDPIATVLDFLAHAKITAAAPEGWHFPKTKNDESAILRTSGFPTNEPTETALPIVLCDDAGRQVILEHWADDSSRDAFKLYAGNRSALSIAEAMIRGKVTGRGTVQINGIRHLWEEFGTALTTDPFSATTPMGGSFNFDARCAWQAIGAGYSPNDHGQDVAGSPIVELLAAWGMQHARPLARQRRQYSYWLWSELLPPILARAAFATELEALEQKRFGFTLELSGKNKIVGYAQQEVAA